MPKVTANTITMHYDQQGTGEPLILIPYLAADHACYAFQVPEYARHFTAISVDLRGTGESDKPQGAYTTELLADDVAAFMQAMGIAQSACRRSVARWRRRHVARGETSGQGGFLVRAQRVDQDRPLPANRCRKLADRGEGRGRSGHDHPGDLSLVLHARALCRAAGLHRIARGIRSEPATAIRAGFPPAVGCRPRA